jgi:hypothetical protein
MAKSRAQIISDATRRARRDFLTFNRKAEGEILDLFLQAKTELLQRMTFGVRAGQFTKARRANRCPEPQAEFQSHVTDAA